MKIYVIHENDEWTQPLKARLDETRLPWVDWNLSKGLVDIDCTPPQGIFYNRMSASSHTRGNYYAPEFTNAVLNWLQSHGRTVFNDTRALALEVNKIAQYTALKSQGILVPKTIGTVGKEALRQAAKSMPGSFITKHNRAGKGLGVKLFHSFLAFDEELKRGGFEDSRDGITLIQQYIESEQPQITRVEFVGQKLLYAVRVDTSTGFELCPADKCSLEDIGRGSCPTSNNSTSEKGAKFTIIPDFDHPLLPLYESFLKSHGIHIAGIEFIMDRNGKTYTYDINTNTNYNQQAEERVGIYGMKAIAGFLGRQLKLLMQKSTSRRGMNRRGAISQPDCKETKFLFV